MSTTPFPAAITTREEIDVILRDAAQAGASDVFVSSGEPVRMRVNGKIESLSNRAIRPTELTCWVTITYDDNPSGASRARSGTPLDYSYECHGRMGSGERLRWRVNVAGMLRSGRTELRVVMRRISSMPPKAESLGVPEALVAASDLLVRGLMIVTGPTGSGKSTTLSALLRRRLETPDDHVHLVTLEAPIEYVYQDVDVRNAVVTQIEVGRHLETFGRGVENALRQDPDLILVGETRDRETASALLQAAQTGHGVYTTLHTNGVAKTLIRMLEVFSAEERDVARESLIDAVQVVLAQRLLPSADGGRVAAYEYLVMGDEVKKRLREAQSLGFSAVLGNLVETEGVPMERYVENLTANGKITGQVRDDFLRRWHADTWTAPEETGRVVA